ncbi:MAG: AsmA family protein [Bacteroidia bacterium]|nr:AsmA family protein [Bacteroidia bacterium]
MKKTAVILFKIFLGLILLMLILIITVPVVFKDKIKVKVEQVINGSFSAKVSFGDYKLGFFRNFPNLAFSLDDVSVVGIGKFENDTLAACKSLNLVFNLSSLFKKTGYEIKSIDINEADIKTLVLKDGSANWDIMTDTTASAPEEESSDMKILLEKIEFTNSSISYIDYESIIETYLEKVNCSMKGDLTGDETNLEININAEELTFLMDGIKYLNKATADSKINVKANLDSMKFYLRDNYLTINDLKLNFAGMVAMPEDDIETDLTFKSEKTSFKSLISMIPAIYMSDFKDLKTSGEFNLAGTAKGIYSDADSTMPDITLNLIVNNGLISYPSLPEQIKNINLKSDIFVDGTDMDKTTVNVDDFHMELAGNPFDMAFALKTPISDPDFTGSMKGKIDLRALSNALPMDSINLSGMIDMSVNMAGCMSMIEKAQYDMFKASGNLNISDMMVSMTGYPDVQIKEAGFEFTPAYAALKNADLNVGGSSDFSLKGRLENYIPYIIKDAIIKGSLSLHSRLVDLSDIMSEIATDTTVADTSSLAVIQVPENINLDFDAIIDQFIYNNIKVQNVKGHVLVKNGILSIRETGMDLLGGRIAMNADYDTRDTLKPFVKADLNIQDLGIKDAFNTFNTIQMLAPTAKGITGKVGVKLNYSSLLGKDFMPLISSISGGGKLVSDEVTLLESAVYNNMKEVLKLGSNYSNTFKDINVSFKVNNGRIYVSPFNTKVGNIKMNISGDQGIDQTINYAIKTEIPRSDLGSSVNSLIDNLSVQAAAFGIAFKPSDLIKVNVKVRGTFLRPVVTPFFGNTPSDSTKGIKETVKETVKEVVGEKVDQAKERVSTEAEIQADKVVREAEEKGKQLRDEAAKAAEKIRQEADIQSQKALKEAETKGTIARLAAQKVADTLKKEADKKANQLVQEADARANKLVDEAKAKREELLKKIES